MTDTMYDDFDAILERTAKVTEGEVITHSLARDIELPRGAGKAVLITLDNGLDHTRPSTLGPGTLRELSRVLDEVQARDDIVAIAITGKPFITAAGADLSLISKITEHEQALEVARIGHGTFHKLANSKIPTFTFINGLALGGGLEIVLSCQYRTVNSTAAGIAFPEVFLGILPGWGGTWLAPNLVGIDTAVKLVIENSMNQNKMLGGQQAFQLGLADAMFDGADYLARSIDWMARVVKGEVTLDRPEIDRSEETWAAAIKAGKKYADSKVSGAAPAPYRALDCLAAARTATREEAYLLEDQGLADLVMTDEHRASLYAFDLVNKRAKRPAGAPDKELARKVTKVGIVGAGLMASQLALLFGRRLGVPVVMSDLDQARVDKGVGYVHAEIDKLLAKKRISPDKANGLKALVTGTTDQADFADCDFVIEAVFEEMGVKQQVFGALEQHVRPDCILATNTSSLSVSEMASGLQHPERVVGFHFFNPVAVLPLLEIIRGEQTDEATLATAFVVAKGLRKNAVLVKDAPAFVANRILLRLMSEVFACVDEGTPIEVADTALAPMGLPMTPFTLLQLVGPAVALHVNETLNDAFGDERFPVSKSLQQIVEQKLPGVYDRDEKGRPFVTDAGRAALVQGDAPSTPEQVLDRCEKALATEIGLMLDEQVVAAPMDIDLCLILGAGWPFHDGGITPYLDRRGASEAVRGKRFLPPGVASLPA
ncbi:3-hydroxyacyl-CoA dehydrogenase NAD-binding domain-containing protein [Enemella evansiae]|uniref:3-hydroxyacyl-CoA dehydrogenase NAD-binding domain-containing protein n=1 Tax=Enemella evansiae TaxID=2016499 RepID=UPI002B4BA8B9|nr:3-hydroxyacyl-CoA dehydrogenase NAD-binding domain-containing protein [Enemella evansiae]